MNENITEMDNMTMIECNNCKTMVDEDELLCDVLHEEAGRTVWRCPECCKIIGHEEADDDPARLAFIKYMREKARTKSYLC